MRSQRQFLCFIKDIFSNIEENTMPVQGDLKRSYPTIDTKNNED